jgi:2-hydroxychromene-2-carboxylate isomerase
MPAKAIWMLKNTLRKAARLGIPLNPPAYHPFNPLLALRASGLPSLSSEERAALVTALFAAVWVDGEHVSDPAVVARAAARVGLDGAAVVAAATDTPAKEHLRRATDAAIARGIFGVPSMEVGDEIFWGYDDFPYLEPVLAGQDLMTADAWNNWMRPVGPSAMRRRFRTT